MWLLGIVRLAFAVLALRGSRPAYGGFVILGLLYFPAKVGFQLRPRSCELAFDLPLAILSLANYGHIVLFASFFVMTRAQFTTSGPQTFAWAASATLLMGALVEIAQGLSGEGNCRLRDLIPDTVGIFCGSIAVLLLERLGWRPCPTWSPVSRGG